MTTPDPKVTRRHALLSGMFFAVAGPAFAGGDGGGGGNNSTSTAPRKPPKTQSKYTQEEFVRLSAAEIAELEGKFRRGKRLEITGFSKNMSDWLILMADHRRSRTQRLIRDMQKLKDKKKRVARLNREKARVEKELKDLEKSKKRAEDKGYERAASEAQTQIGKTKDYIKGLNNWIKNPHEGNF